MLDMVLSLEMMQCCTVLQMIGVCVCLGATHNVLRDVSSSLTIVAYCGNGPHHKLIVSVAVVSQSPVF